MGITVKNDYHLPIDSISGSNIPEALTLVNELIANITTILKDSVTSTFATLKENIHEHPLYVLFEPKLGCNPLTDHQTPKDVYPIFQNAITSAEDTLGNTSISMIVDELREKIITALNYEVHEKNIFKTKAEDALGELAEMKSRLIAKEKIVQQITQSKLDEHTKLMAEITVLREQAFMKRRFGDRYKPDNIERIADDSQGQGQGLNASLLGSTGELAVSQGTQVNRMIREQLTSILAENKDLKLKVEAANLVQSRIAELENENSTLLTKIQQLESENEEAIIKLQNDLKDKMSLIATYQQNEFTLNASIQDMTRQLKTLEKKRLASAEPTSRSDADLSRENAELKNRVYELQEKLMLNPVEEKTEHLADVTPAESIALMREELRQRTEEADGYRKKLEEAGLLYAPVDEFIRLSEHTSSVSDFKRKFDQIERRNQDLEELCERLQRQIDHLIENEANEINSVLEANEYLHKQKLKNAVEAAVCIDGFNESIQAAKNAILNFNDVGCQVPDKRSKKSAVRLGENDPDDQEETQEDIEASRVRRAINAAKKIYANRLPTVTDESLSYNISSVDEVFKHLFDTAKDAKSQLMKKHHEDLQQEAETLMKNLKLHNRIASVVSDYTKGDTKPLRDSVKLLSKSQLRDVLCEGMDQTPSEASISEDEEERENVSHTPFLESKVRDGANNALNEAFERPPAKPDGPAPRGRKRKASPSKSKSGRSTTSTVASFSTRPETHKSVDIISDTTKLHTPEPGDLDEEKEFFRGSTPHGRATLRKLSDKEAINSSDSRSQSISSDSNVNAQITYQLSETGKRIALKKTAASVRSFKPKKASQLLIKLIKDKLSGDVRDELGRLVDNESLYMYGYCLDKAGNLVYYGDCPVHLKASADSESILRKFPANNNGDLVLPNGQCIPRGDALRFGYKGPARDNTYIFTGQPPDLYDQIMQLSPSSVSAMTHKILGLDIEYDDIIADFDIKLDLDEVTQKPYVYIDPSKITNRNGSSSTTKILPDKKADDYLNSIGHASLKIPEEDAFKVGILPNANGDYRYARPILNLQQVDDSLVIDPQGNEILLEDAITAGFIGPFGPNKEYYYFSPISLGDTRTCELVSASNDTMLKITTSNDVTTSYEVPLSEAYKHGFLPNANGEYHYAGELLYLWEKDANDNVLYDLLDREISRSDAEKYGYVRHNDGRYYYVGAKNLNSTSAPELTALANLSLGICDSSFTEQEPLDINVAEEIPKDLEITLLYDKDLELFIDNENGNLIDNTTMLRKYGYLVDQQKTPHFVGVGNVGQVVNTNTEINVPDQFRTVIVGYDDKVHIYNHNDINEYYSNNVTIMPKRINITKLQKRLEAADDAEQLCKMAKHMKKLEERCNPLPSETVQSNKSNSSHSSDKVSILVDCSITKSTVLDIHSSALQNTGKGRAQPLMEELQRTHTSAVKDLSRSLVFQELIDADVQALELVPTPTHKIETSVVHVEASESISRSYLDTLQNCTIIDDASLGTELARVPQRPPEKSIVFAKPGSLMSHTSPFHHHTPRFGRGHGVGLVVTSYGTPNDNVRYLRNSSFKTCLLTPAGKGHFLSQNIVKPATSNIFKARFDREAGIVFDEQTNQVLGHVNTVTGDIEDNTGRTIGHVELTSHTIKHEDGTVHSNDNPHLLNSSAKDALPKRSFSHDPSYVSVAHQNSTISFIDAPLRAFSTGAVPVFNTPTRMISNNNNVSSSAISSSSIQRPIIDSRSGRSSQRLGRPEPPVLVVLHDSDTNNALDSSALADARIATHAAISPRGGSAPARKSVDMLDTDIKDDSIVSMYDGIFPGIKDRTTLSAAPSKVIRAMTRHAIGSTPPIIQGMHNIAPLPSSSLHVTWKDSTPATDVASLTQPRYNGSTAKAHSTIKRGASATQSAKTYESPLRAQSIRRMTGHGLPSMVLPDEFLRRSYYRDENLNWVPYSRVVIVPDESKLFSMPQIIPSSALKNIANGIMQQEEQQKPRARLESAGHMKAVLPVKRLDEMASIQVPSTMNVHPVSSQARSKSLTTRNTKLSNVLPSSNENTLKRLPEKSFKKMNSYSFCSETPTSNQNIAEECSSMLVPPQLPPLVISKTNPVSPPDSEKPENVQSSSLVHSFTKDKQTIDSTSPRPLLSESHKEHTALRPQREAARLMNLIQNDIDVVRSSSTFTRKLISTLKSADGIEPSGLAVNTSPRRAYK